MVGNILRALYSMNCLHTCQNQFVVFIPLTLQIGASQWASGLQKSPAFMGLKLFLWGVWPNLW